MNKYSIRVNVNREWRTAEVTATETLLDTLRNKWRAVEVKNGCAQGDCGACSVLLQGRPVNACLVLSVQANEKEVTTVKGIGTRENPHPLQTARNPGKSASASNRLCGTGCHSMRLLYARHGRVERGPAGAKSQSKPGGNQ